MFPVRLSLPGAGRGPFPTRTLPRGTQELPRGPARRFAARRGDPPGDGCCAGPPKHRRGRVIAPGTGERDRAPRLVAGPQLRWSGATLGCPRTPGVPEIPANSWLNIFLVEWSPSCGALRSPTQRGDEWEITSHQAAVTRSRSCRPLEGSLWLRPDLCPEEVDAHR